MKWKGNKFTFWILGLIFAGIIGIVILLAVILDTSQTTNQTIISNGTNQNINIPPPIIPPVIPTNITQTNQTNITQTNQTNVTIILELCDNLDNDSDGIIDEDVICNNKLVIQNGDVFIKISDINGDTSIQQLKENNSGQTIEFAQTPIFKIFTLDNSQSELTPSSFNDPIYEKKSATESNLIWTSTNNLGIKVIVTTKQLISGSIDYDIKINNTGTKILNSVNFPTAKLESLTENSGESEFIALPSYGGMLLPLYLSEIPPAKYKLPGELPMQYFSVYTSNRMKQFFMQTTDSEGYLKELSLIQNKDSKQLTTSIKHFPENNLNSGNQYGSPYSVRMAILSGNWYDSAKYYREWAIQQTWIPQPIETNNDFSPILKNTKLFTLLSTETTTSDTFNSYYQSLTNLQNFYNFNNWELMSLWYRWHNNSFDRDLPQHLPPRPGVVQALGNALVKKISVIPYSFNGLWAPSLPSYATNNINSLVSKDEFGQSQTMNLGLENQAHAHLNPSIPSARNLIKNNILNIMNLGFSGLYWDAYTMLPPQLDYSSGRTHPNGGGKYWTQGKISLFEETRNALKQINEDKFIGTEWPNEYLFNSVEMVYTQFAVIGITMPLVKAVYGDRIIISDLSLMGNSIPTLLSEEHVKLIHSFMFHSGEMASITDWAHLNPLTKFIGNETSNSITPSQTEVLSYIGVLINHPETRKYQRFGEFLRPLSGSFLDVYGTSQLTLTNLEGVMSSVWKAQNGDIGIIATNHKSISQEFNAILTPEKYPLSGQYTLYENINGVRTEISNSVEGTITIPINVEPNSLRLFELVSN